MSHYIGHITFMARGESGRIVIEVDPETKRRLYAALALSGSTLKDWFLKSAASFCSDAGQLPLFNIERKPFEFGHPAPNDVPAQVDQRDKIEK